MSDALEIHKQWIRVAKETKRPSQEILQTMLRSVFSIGYQYPITAPDSFSKAVYFSQGGVSMIFE